jgi:hypothetical protein
MITVSDKKRWFWDSNLAENIEHRLFQLAWWWTDKRFPVETENMDLPTEEEIGTVTSATDTAPSTPPHMPWESWKSSDFTVVEEPKKKRAAKTTKKKKAKKV